MRPVLLAGRIGIFAEGLSLGIGGLIAPFAITTLWNGEKADLGLAMSLLAVGDTHGSVSATDAVLADRHVWWSDAISPCARWCQ